MSKRDYRRKGAQRTGGEVGGCLHVVGYMVLIHPVRWMIARVRGKPAPSIPEYIQRELDV